MSEPRSLLHRAVFETTVLPLVLRAGGSDQAITTAERDELLAALRDGKHVELAMDLMPFRQRPGQRNRNSVRFRDGGLHRMGQSGKGMPFLRDHRQGDMLSVGGYITASGFTDEPIDGAVEKRLHQSVQLSAPWAVDAALRGLIRFFSIGWDPDGIMCLACNDDFMNCYHWPGEKLEDGRVVEIEYQNATLVETSMVPVPAVLGTEVEGIRAAMAAARGGLDTATRAPQSRANKREKNMPRFARLITLLALSVPQGAELDEEVAAKAVEGLHGKLAKVELERDGYKLRAETAEHDLEEARTQLGQRDETDRVSKLDAAIAQAYADRKLLRGAGAEGESADDPFEALLRRQAELDSVDAAVAAIATLRVRAPFGPQITASKDPIPRTDLGKSRGFTASELAAHRRYAEQTGRDPEKYIADLIAEQGA